MRLATVFLVIAVVIGALGFAAWHFVLREQVAFAQVATAYVAKQACSCRHVAGRSLESCLGDFTQDISQLDVRDTLSAGRPAVTASALGLVSETAAYQPAMGCSLQPKG